MRLPAPLPPAKVDCMAALRPRSLPSLARLPHYRTAAAQAPPRPAPAGRRHSCCPARLPGALLPGGWPAGQQAGSRTGGTRRYLPAARQMRCQPLLQQGSPRQHPDPRTSSCQAPTARLAHSARHELRRVGGSRRAHGDAAARRQQRRQARRAGRPHRARRTRPAAAQVCASTLSNRRSCC